MAQQILLHGMLHANIFEAVGLTHPVPTYAGCLPECLTKDQMAAKGTCMKVRSWIKRVSLCRPKELAESIEESVGVAKQRVYATIDLEKARVGRTRIIQNEPARPQWNEFFHIYCAHRATDVIFTIKNDNPIGASVLGRAYVPVTELLNDEVVERWVDICDDHRQPIHEGAKIHVKLYFSDITKDSNWSQGISPEFPGVAYTFFPQQKGCRVMLYQDAHVADNFIPRIPLAGGKYYEPQRCWEDIFDAINNARHLVYITGWSVFAEMTLMRDLRRQTSEKDETLGELLKRKARGGVRVLMLVWDDRTSVSVGLLKKDGLMATHDQDTAKYFHGTGVHCVLCPRVPDNGRSVVQGLEISSMFTHHQKSVVVDSAIPGTRSERRRIVSFVGGIDLCDGRYDTQLHSLFRTLDSTHKNDFHQPNFPNSSIKKGGPREPWHDIHCQLEGPVAWDVFTNFEQRWMKQGGNKTLLLKQKDLADTIPRSTVTTPQDRETWNVQLFRSIDGGAASDFPETPDAAARAGLVSGKDSTIDRSIQDAYINAIRRAKDFIYIENQYFLGSSFDWKEEEGIKVEDIGALHLIPKELSLKIVSKIKAGQRFAVYIVVPMWPEGIPESASVQAILEWQRRTMEMMYSDIALGLRKKGLNANPKEYLTFFCLANREVKKCGEYSPPEQPEPDSDYIRAQQARRFMIYVHSKMMIVDDEYIIIGSANINQRSMDGSRDTEIAMGAYQPYHLATKQPARGQIHGFRMALWYEHLCVQDDSFLSPQSVDCIRKVNAIADKYWELYTSAKLENDQPGHLLSYPIGVSNTGEVTQLPGIEFFPDTKARILGTKSDYLPSILTT